MRAKDRATDGRICDRDNNDHRQKQHGAIAVSQADYCAPLQAFCILAN